MANPVLAEIICDGCGNQASIKKLNNSPLLYLHCKTCGMDRRSGQQLQAKWQAAIDGKSDLPAVIEGAEQDEKLGAEWKPPVEEKPEGEAEDNKENSGISGKSIAVGTIGALSVLAMFFKAIKG